MPGPSSLSLSIVVALVMGAAACSRAQDPGRPAAPAGATSVAAPAPASPATPAKVRPKVIQAIERQGLQVFGEFDAPGGLRGFAGMANQQPMAVYLAPDGKHALVGVLVDEDGKDAGAEAVQRLVAAPMSQRIWSQLEKSHWVADGKADAPRVVYAFSDPNCPYCHRFWEAARPWVDAGKVQLRHVLVGIIREDSANKVATILSAPSPPSALAANEQSYGNGGVEPSSSVPPDIRRQLDENEHLMVELGFQGTPGILFRDAQGVVQRRSGLPSPQDLKTVLGPR